MIVFLLGFMGCGKSRRGKELAAFKKWQLIDIDDVFVQANGITITAYFEKYGEMAFRTAESEILKNYVYPENCVVAVGGGLPCFFDNMRWMNSRGTTIYLKMEPLALVGRLHNRAKRPLIKGMDDEALLRFIEIKLAEREMYYLQAGLTVNGLNLTGADLAALLQ